MAATGVPGIGHHDQEENTLRVVRCPYPRHLLTDPDVFPLTLRACFLRVRFRDSPPEQMTHSSRAIKFGRLCAEPSRSRGRGSDEGAERPDRNVYMRTNFLTPSSAMTSVQ